MSITSSRTRCSSDGPGGTASPAYCVSRESSCTEPFNTSSRSRIASAKWAAIWRRWVSFSFVGAGSAST